MYGVWPRLVLVNPIIAAAQPAVCVPHEQIELLLSPVRLYTLTGCLILMQNSMLVKRPAVYLIWSAA